MITQRIIAPFWRRRWLILTTTLTVIAGTLFWAQGLPTVYESSLTLAANSQDGTSIQPGHLARIRQELRNKSVYYQVVKSDLFNDRRASGESNDVLVEQLQRSIGMTEHLHGTSAVIHLRYLDPKLERAQMVAAVLGESIEEIEAKNASAGAVVFSVEQPATPAPGPIKPRLFVIAVFALGVGILSGLVLAGLSALFGSRRHREVRAPVV